MRADVWLIGLILCALAVMGWWVLIPLFILALIVG